MFSTFFILCLGILAATRSSETQRQKAGPRVVTEPQDFEVEAGSTVLLPCSIRNVGRRSVFWFKGDAPEGRELIMQMTSVRGQFEVPREYQDIIDTGKLNIDGASLILNNVVAADSASYTCTIAWARQSVTHHLTVIGGDDIPATVTTIPSNGQVNVGEGLPVSLSCITTWDPPATVSWYKEGEPEVLTVGNVLNFFTSNRDDSGRYYCRVENGVAVPVKSYFNLVVEYVNIEADVGEVVASAEEQKVQLSCTVSGSPKPQVAWYTSVGPVTQDNRHHLTSQGDTHYLQLLQMTSADLGEYQCYGYNEKSRDHATIKVTSPPGPVTVLGVTPYQGQRYTVTWETKSLSPIRFYHVALRERGTDRVDSSSVPGSSNPSDGRSLFRASGEFDMQPGRTYEIMIKAVDEAYLPGPDQKEPYVFSVPIGQVAPVTNDDHRSPANSRPPPQHQPAPRGYESRYDNQGQNYRDQNYGGQTYRGREQPHGEEEQSYNSQGQSYGQNYGSQGSSYGDGSTSYGAEDDDYTDETQTEVSDRDAWNWWKVTMTLMSRLPQVARIMQ